MDKESKDKNSAFIDGQNLHIWTAKRGRVAFWHLMMSYFYMIEKTLDKKIDFLVEQKLNELLGDPDSFFPLNKQFSQRLKVRLSKAPKIITHSQVEKKYGLR